MYAEKAFLALDADGQASTDKRQGTPRPNYSSSIFQTYSRSKEEGGLGGPKATTCTEYT